MTTEKLALTLFIVLLIGTLFAWTNFGIELYTWIKGLKCPVGCPTNIKNPFLTPCFGGAVFFTISLVLSILLKRKI